MKPNHRALLWLCKSCVKRGALLKLYNSCVNHDSRLGFYNSCVGRGTRLRFYSHALCMWVWLKNRPPNGAPGCVGPRRDGIATMRPHGHCCDSWRGPGCRYLDGVAGTWRPACAPAAPPGVEWDPRGIQNELGLGWI